MFQTLIAQIKEYKKPLNLVPLHDTLVMFEISIPLSHGSFGQRCPAIQHVQHLASRWPLCWPAPSYHHSAAQNTAMQLASAGFAKQLTSGHFQEGSNLSLKISISFQLVVCNTYDDWCDQRAELLPDDYPYLCACATNLIFAIAASFLITGEMVDFRWCNTLPCMAHEKRN